jgi:hypothetical protein
VIEADSQVMLNILTEHNFQEVFKSGRSAGMLHKHGKGILQELWLPVGPTLVFNHMAAPVPESMHGCGMFLSRYIRSVLWE